MIPEVQVKPKPKVKPKLKLGLGLGLETNMINVLLITILGFPSLRVKKQVQI